MQMQTCAYPRRETCAYPRRETRLLATRALTHETLQNSSLLAAAFGEAHGYLWHAACLLLSHETSMT